MLTLTSPVETWLHRRPAGVKLLGLCLVTIALFQIEDLRLAGAVLAGLGLVYLSFGMAFFRQGVRLLRPIWPFVVIVLAWHALTDDLVAGTLIIIRLMTAIALANLVTMTTRLSDMIEVIEKITPSIAAIGLNPKSLALSIALTIRFIPVLGQKIEQINAAWRARSVRRTSFRILIPVLLAVLDDAEHVAEALRARGGIN